MTIKMPHTVKPVNDDKKAEAFIAGAGALKTSSTPREITPPPAEAQDDNTAKAVVNMRFDTQLLARIDVAAKRQGISRTAWLHVAASKALENSGA